MNAHVHEKKLFVINKTNVFSPSFLSRKSAGMIND